VRETYRVAQIRKSVPVRMAGNKVPADALFQAPFLPDVRDVHSRFSPAV